MISPRFKRRLRRRPAAALSGIFLVALALAALLAPWIAPFDPAEQDLQHPFLGPSGDHLLGTDGFGRDLLTRLLFGARTSLGVALCVVAIAMAISVPLGLLAGFRGGRLDLVLMRIMDAALSVPPLILALAIAGVLGPGVRNVVIALTVIYIPSMVRLTRAQTLTKRQETFIEASLVAGTRTPKILRLRILPNIASPLFVASAFWIGGAILAEAGLSYLGIGAQPPAASWGNMLRQAYDSSLFTNTYQLLVPGCAIALTILAANTLGEGLRDVYGTANLSSSGRRRRGITSTLFASDANRGSRWTRQANVVASQLRTPSDALLSIEGLSVEFEGDAGTTKVVTDMELRIKTGEVVGLVGESGSGKTVTSLSIMRLIPSPPGRIVSGSIWFEGRDLLTLDFAEMRKIRGAEIAMVFQDPMTSLDPSFTIGDQLIEAIRLHRSMSRSAARARAAELLELVQIPSGSQRLRDYPHQLSGGMRQRVVIAMALACEPKLLIADEPTTALDVTIQAQILELLKDLQRELGMAILFVTHDLGVVADICDRVVVMYAGELVEENTVEALFATPAHPYTAGLLAAMPHVELTDQRLNVIPGQVPMPNALPSGCRFQPRCNYHVDACADEGTVQVVGIGTGRSRCLRAEELTLVGVGADRHSEPEADEPNATGATFTRTSPVPQETGVAG